MTDKNELPLDFLKKLQGMDQALAATLDMAKLAAAYSRNLRTEGFSPADTLALTRDFMTTIIQHGLSQNKGDQS